MAGVSSGFWLFGFRELRWIMAFQSEFEDSQKLKDCAEKDIDHVGEQFAPDGPWVVLIKKALNARYFLEYDHARGQWT